MMRPADGTSQNTQKTKLYAVKMCFGPFDIYILTGVKIIFGKTAVNKLMMEIEAEIEKRLPVTLVQRHTLGKAVVPNFGYSSRTKLRTTAL